MCEIFEVLVLARDAGVSLSSTPHDEALVPNAFPQQFSRAGARGGKESESGGVVLN